ncbi:MAG: UvrD-helicase domain-containing protein [Rhodothermus sp.]|nr:UvrD-helicase domain-containing protein [Rhodothermus sp.]
MEPIVTSLFELVSASAGSGKTHQLTLRLLQRLIEAGGDPHRLRSILALTFTNNAAREMRRRLLTYLKGAALGENETIQRLQEALGPIADMLGANAPALIDTLLTHYDALQVMTIDRFVGRWLRGVAHEWGCPPSFELVLDGRALFEAAFEAWAVEAQATGRLQALVALLLDTRASDASFLWDPYGRLRDRTRQLYEYLMHRATDPDSVEEPDPRSQLSAELQQVVAEIQQFLARAKAPVTNNFQKLLKDAEAGDLDRLVERKLDQQAFRKHPQRPVLENALRPLRERLQRIIKDYVAWLARHRPIPALRAYRQLRTHLQQQQQEQGQVLLSEATRMLQAWLEAHSVSAMKRRMGTIPVHLLIDEFQDTSPVQWAILKQVADHGLREGGSLFVVGDTKQAIYGFRGGDWQIMAALQERSPFDGVFPVVQSLTVNYRSDGKILQFVQHLFETQVSDALLETEAARQFFVRSGLAQVGQTVKPGREQAGYVTYQRLASMDAAAEEVVHLLRGVRRRGYSWRDMAVLAPRNADVVAVSQWLAAAGIPFLSHSSLDVRRRPVIDGVRSLLQFLDRPIDDLAFASVLLSPLLQHKKIHAFLIAHRDTRPLYPAFRGAFPECWEAYFEPLFARVGYLPLYELISEVYRIWRLFERFPEEQAALVKWLEVARDFEAKGHNALHDFLETVAEDVEEDDWDLPVTEGQEAVSVMTVHKAKGLEFPVVLVFWPLMRGRTEPWWIEQDAGGSRLLMLRKDYGKHDPCLARYYEAREAMARIDELCRVYVALTRARHELHVRVVASENRQKPWIDRFWPEEDGVWGHPTTPEGSPTTTIRQLRPAGRSPRYEAAVAAIVPATDRAAVRLGELCHAALARLKTLADNVSEQVYQAVQAALAGYPEWEAHRDAAIRLLHQALTHAAVRPFFESVPGRVVHTEWEVLDASGQARRIDRLLIDPDAITVIDFKVGRPESAHADQLRAYVELVQTIWPAQPVRAALVYLQPVQVHMLS